MSIVSSIRTWFNKEVLSRVDDVESRVERLLQEASEKEAEVKKLVVDFLTSAQEAAESVADDVKVTLDEVDFDKIKKAVIAEVLVALKAEGVQIAEATLEKYGVPAVVAEPVVKAAAEVVEDIAEKLAD